MALLLILVILTLCTVAFRYRRRRLYKLAAQFPSTNNELPVIGVAYAMAGNTQGEWKVFNSNIG